jgi:hypothetical protein
LSSAHYTHIKRTPKSRCAICSGFEDTTNMTAHSRATGLPDLAGDHKPQLQPAKPLCGACDADSVVCIKCIMHYEHEHGHMRSLTLQKKEPRGYGCVYVHIYSLYHGSEEQHGISYTLISQANAASLPLSMVLGCCCLADHSSLRHSATATSHS